MTRKKLIAFALEFFKAGMEAQEVGMPNFDQLIKTEFYKGKIDEILALPIDVPGDEEIEKEYPSDIEAIRDEWGFPYDCSEEQINFLQTERINAQMKQRAAKWMRDEIIKRNRP